MTPHNSYMRHTLISLILTFSFNLWAQSTPVYVQPNNPAPTGHFDLKQLKKNSITHDQFEWLWVKDDFGHAGWVLKSALMLPLDFSRQAILAKGEAIYPEPKSYNLPQKSLEKAQIVSLLGRHRDWYKVLYKEGENKLSGWVRSRYLRPYSKDPGYFYSMKEVPLRQKPQIKSQFLGQVKTGTPIIPLKIVKSWAYVKSGKRKGYIPLQNIKSRVDIAMKVKTPEGYFKPHPKLIHKKINEIFANPLWAGTGDFTVDLKSKPDMGSNSVITIKPWQSLYVQGYSIKRWSKSFVSRWGDLWWPEQTVESNIEIIESFQPEMQRLMKSEVYQVVRSPKVPGLRFASTVNGIFRSFNGKLWHALPDFKHGYPIRFAKDGTFFAGDKVSFDNGESFHSYIRWDKVLSSLPIESKLGHGPIQIINVEPNIRNHKRVTLSLKLGSNRILQIYTPNLGKSWRVR